MSGSLYFSTNWPSRPWLSSPRICQSNSSSPAKPSSETSLKIASFNAGSGGGGGPPPRRPRPGAGAACCAPVAAGAAAGVAAPPAGGATAAGGAPTAGPPPRRPVNWRAGHVIPVWPMTTLRFLPDAPCAQAGSDGSVHAPSAIAAVCANVRRSILLFDMYLPLCTFLRGAPENKRASVCCREDIDGAVFVQIGSLHH